MENKEYKAPVIEIIVLNEDDIITTSTIDYGEIPG